MKKALLVIDVQNEYFTGLLPVTYPENSFDNIKDLINASNANNIPVIYIQHTSNIADAKTFIKNSREWMLHPELLKLSYDALVEKNYPSSFANTNLDEILKELGIGSIAICGYMAQMCCDSTAREAFHKGYEVEFISDAVGTLDIMNYAGSINASDLHKAVIITQAMKFSKVISTDTFIKTIA